VSLSLSPPSPFHFLPLSPDLVRSARRPPTSPSPILPPLSPRVGVRE
jgi:hypothetical protein